MLDNDHGYVALFIDWDNLAISIAADLGGATPDLRRIVHKAQEYGTVLVAKAYAEWQMTSDRLSVYRAGIEPVYAPTFRFEPDLAGQPPRGKSLADPCLVADCVDCLHLFPQVTTFVIVSGDKDLIPIVRLAQLRGKRVVVIGPDYAAGVLREMADQFISYRLLIEDVESQSAAETIRREPSRSSRRHVPPREIVSTGVQHGTRGAARERVSTPSAEPIGVSATSVPTVEHETRVEAGPAASAQMETIRREPAEDLKEVFRTMAEVLAERSQDGRARIRATNLKDILMQRIPGFSERRYGFTKFKDLLMAARKAGVVEVTQAGPVHWVSLPEPAAGPEEVAAAAPAQASAAPTVTPTLPGTAPTTPETEETAQLELTPEQGLEITRFIYELSQRSRWLTYTYVLTNLISYLGRNLSPQAADTAARSVLGYLVQENVLRVDREPREVEVGGVKHRVRMCHLEDDHPWVKQVTAAQVEKAAEVSEQAESAETASANEPAGEEHGSTDGSEGARSPEPGATLSTAQAAETPAAAPAEAEAQEPFTSGAAETEPSTVSGEEAGSNGHDEGSGLGVPLQVGEPQPQATEGGEDLYLASEGGTESAIVAEPPALEQTFAALGEILRASVSADKPRVRAAGLRAKLSKALGHFNERDYGFQRFKDFLMAAEREGWVQAYMRGGNTWVALGTRLQQEPEAD